MGQIIEINTDRMIQPKTQSNLFTNRALFVEMQRGRIPAGTGRGYLDLS